MARRLHPTYDRELAHGGIVAGVDEVGRGPWAGPVVAAAVILDPKRIPDGLDDSKRLSAKRRELLCEMLYASAHIAIGSASVEEIDNLNIRRATFLAMERAVWALPYAPALVLVDGNASPSWTYACETVVGGDGKCQSIAAASIVAKVARDRIMAELDAAHPGFGWASNMGYGTAEHAAALARFGPTPQHRRSFRPVAAVLKAGC